MPVVAMMMVGVADGGEAVAQFADRLILLTVAVETIEDGVADGAGTVTTRGLMARIKATGHARIGEAETGAGCLHR